MRLITSIIAVALLASCNTQRAMLDLVRDNNELVVVTRPGPTTYFQGAEGPDGLEYHLANQFADHLGVRLRIITAKNTQQALDWLQRGKAHIAAAGIIVAENQSERLRFGPAYQEITQQLVYNIDKRRPEDVEQMLGARIAVQSGSHHADELRNLKAFYPELVWHETQSVDTQHLMEGVARNEMDFTLADSNELAVSKRFNPKLEGSLVLGTPQELAWAFTKSRDNSLYNESLRFFRQMRESRKLAQMMERFYGHVHALDYVGTRTFLNDVEERLPKLKPLFKKAATESGLDWRLIAAIGYQESHWNANAISPTGVRGLMMLTRQTAEHLGVKNRLDPKESIMGGARYLRMIRDEIPENVPEPVRTWLALAAYNVGPGHLQDALHLTDRNGGETDKWLDVKQNLPLLRKREWFVKTRYGYARGDEPVHFVRNVRNYYDILVWMTEPKPTLTLEEDLEPEQINADSAAEDIISPSMLSVL